MNENKMISSRYVKTTILLSLLVSLLVFITEYSMYRTAVQNKLIGLHQAWQSNANQESNIKRNYPDYVLSSYRDINSYLGLSNESNIKKWFNGYLEKVCNTDMDSSISDNLESRPDDNPVPWRTEKDIDIYDYVTYTHGFWLKRYPFPKDTTYRFIKRTFQEYVRYINYTFPELVTGPKNRLSLNDFDRYNQITSNKLYQGNTADFVLVLPYIKIHRFFIASVTDTRDSLNKEKAFYNMAVFPAYTDQSFKELEVPKRPWFKAAILNTFPLHYRKSDETYAATFGLTGLYNDITTVTTTVLDRTLTCVFTVPNVRPGTKFIACVDLFFDNSVEFTCPSPFRLSRNANIGSTSLASHFPFLGIPAMPLGYCSVIDGFLIFWLMLGLLQIALIKKYVIRGLEGILNQFNSEKYIYFKIERTLVHSLTVDNVQNPPKIKLEHVTQNLKSQESTMERGVGVNGSWRWFYIIFKRNYKDTSSSADNATITSTSELTLGIDNVNYYKRIEFWKIYNRSKTSLVGEFIVKWLNAIYTKEELAIDLTGDFKSKMKVHQKDKAIVYLKKEFENRLLSGEEAEFEIKVDLTETIARQLIIPYSIERIEAEGESIVKYFTRMGRLNRFFEKKLFFRYRDDSKIELEYFLRLYDNMHIYSVCGIAFLKNLEVNNSLLEFIMTTADKERLFIETEEGEFVKFIRPLSAKIRSRFGKLDPEKFRIYSFDATRSSVINKFKNYDFAIVKNDGGKTEYILYHTPTSTIAEIGWASWRSMDIDFYMAVYTVIRNELYPSSISIKDYIKNNKLDDKDEKQFY